MTCLNRPLLSAVLLAFLVGVGCSTTGGQTGEESQGACDEASVALDLDEVSPLGFSPRDLLATVGDASNATLRWQPLSDLTYGPENGDSRIEFTVRSIVSAHFIPSEARSDREQLAMPICEDRVAVTVSAAAATAGGAVAEEFQATLSATTAQHVWLSQLIDPVNISGSFSFDPQSLGTRRLIRLTLEAHWTTDSFRGFIAAGIEQSAGSGADSSVSFSMIPVACFSDSATFDPTAACTTLR